MESKKPFHLALLALALSAAPAAADLRFELEATMIRPGADAELGRPAHDPFATLIEKPTRDPRGPRLPQVNTPPPPPSKPAPVQVRALGHIEVGGERMVMIQYRGAEYVVGAGWKGEDEPGFDKRFKVVQVTAEGLVVYDSLRKERRTIREPDAVDGAVELAAR